MNLIEKYNNTDNAQRQQMFYEYLKKSGLKESSYRQYALTYPNNDTVINVVYEVSKKNNLFEVVDLLQVQTIYKKVNETDANKRINNALSATIYNYKKFLDYLETKDSEVLEENVKTISDEDIKEAYRDYLKRLEGKYGGYVAAIDAPFAVDAVKELYNLETAFSLRDSKSVLSLVDYIRSDSKLNESDQSLNNRRTSCSLKKYAEFLDLYSDWNTEEKKQGHNTEVVENRINPNIWVYSPGEGAQKWQECQDDKMMMLGWDEMFDFQNYSSREKVVEGLRSVYGNEDNSYKNDSLAIWQFCREMRPGDIVYVKRGMSLIVGRGIVKGDYFFNEERYEFKNCRSVDWTDIGEWEYPKKLPMKVLTRINDFKDMVARLGSLFNPVEQKEQIPYSMQEVINSIKQTGLLYEDKLIQRYACSLMTKPFVILSGLAGSGKTQLALAFARVMSENVDQQLCVVPVGADWTNREPLLGYPNALKQGEYILPESGALQIMMRALRNPQKPYFLVLDEMNLSYVERYFADFLSALESYQEIPLWERPEDCDSEVPAKIALPRNLFIIGTINVDETTYMFSPKVLDRANVIEFKISDNEMDRFLKQNMNIDVHAADGACAEMGRDFVEKTGKKETEASELAQSTLIAFFKELKKVNAEFGYRSATEIYRFITNAKKCAKGMSENDILDAAIVQKLLPKLHGSRKKLDGALKALWKLCMPADSKVLDVPTSEEVDKAIYKESADKIVRMYNSAQENGFTSFAEA